MLDARSLFEIFRPDTTRHYGQRADRQPEKEIDNEIYERARLADCGLGFGTCELTDDYYVGGIIEKL